MATKSKLELVREAQAEVQETINNRRIEFIESLQELKEIGGADNIEKAVLDIGEHFKGGISLPLLQTVAPEPLLAKALKKLESDGKIKRAGKKGNVTIEFIEAK